jgi:hypothetical protein
MRVGHGAPQQPSHVASLGVHPHALTLLDLIGGGRCSGWPLPTTTPPQRQARDQRPWVPSTCPCLRAKAAPPHTLCCGILALPPHRASLCVVLGLRRWTNECTVTEQAQQLARIYPPLSQGSTRPDGWHETWRRPFARLRCGHGLPVCVEHRSVPEDDDDFRRGAR